MSDQIDVLRLVGERLDRAGIPYMVTGSMAMNYYAQPRMTRDIDLVVDVDAADAARFTDLFAQEFYGDADGIRSAIAERGLFNLIHLEHIVKVDIIVRKESAYRRLEFDRRRQVTVDGGLLWVVSPEDLLLSKLAWAKESRSQVQLGDVRNLIDAVDGLDWAYIERWAWELGVTALLDEARR